MFTIKDAPIEQVNAHNRDGVNVGRPSGELANTFANLGVGQYFTVNQTELSQGEKTFRAHCWQLSRKHGFKVSVRKTRDGFDVFRVEP